MDLKANLYLFFVVLFSLFLISGILTAEEDILNNEVGAENSHSEPIFRVEWTVEGEAERLAEKLLSAHTPAEAKVIINQILYRLGVGVYDYQGRPVVIGNERSKDDFWLYEYQVEILARAFIRKDYIPLKLQVEGWDLYRKAGFFSAAETALTDEGALDSIKLENILRELRQKAEEEPENPEWFLIRLFDALGDRKEHPFNLLADEKAEAEDPLKSLGAEYKEIFKEEMNKAHQEAEESGVSESRDTENLPEISDENMDELMEAAMEGDIFKMMGAFMEEEELEEMWGTMGEAIEEMDQGSGSMEADPEMAESVEAGRKLLKELHQMRDGGDLRQFSESSLELVRENRDSLRALLQRQKKEIQAGSDQGRADLADDAAAIALQGFGEVENQAGVLGLEWSLQLSENTYDKFEAQMERVEEQRKEFEKIEEEHGVIPLNIEEDEGSNLMLDPFQNFLLHLDTFSPREADNYVHRENNFKNPLDLVLKNRVTASSHCDAIGSWVENNSDLFGIIRSAYLAGDIGDVNSIISGFIESHGTMITAEVEYTGGKDSIHLYHTNESSDRRELIIKPKLEYMFDHGEAVVNCGPLAGFDLPPVGPMEDVRVRFYPGDLLDYTNVRSNWFTIRPTYTNLTDENGIAEGRFYPNWADPDLGGKTDYKDIEVKLVGMPTPGLSIIYSSADWIMNMRHELFSPINTKVPVRIEYHKPTPLKGQVVITRMLSVYSNVEVEGPQLRGENRDVEYDRVEHWDLTVAFDDGIELDSAGRGEGSYTARLSASSLKYDNTWEKAVFCTEDGTALSSPSDGPVNQIVRVKTMHSGTADGTVFDTGSIWLDFDSQHNRYRLQIEPLLVDVMGKLAEPGRFSGRLDIKVEETDCEGGPRTREVGSSNLGFDNIPPILFQPIAIPEGKWVDFDRDAEKLESFISYPVNIRSRDGKVTYEMNTLIEWNLDRITED